jgi:hypothetical protein
MAKKVMHLAEEDLKEVVKKSVKSVLDEARYDEIDGFGAITYGNPFGMCLAKPSKLLEGLIKTYPIEKTVKYMRKFLGFNEDDDTFVKLGKDEQNGNFIDFYVLKKWKYYSNIISQIKKGMNLCGYHFSFQIDVVYCNEMATYLQYEPKFNDKIADINKWNTIYHVTSIYNFQKIKEIGLCPKSSNTFLSYPPRVYCFNGDSNLKDIIDLTSSLDMHKNIDSKDPSKYDEKHLDRRYIIISINTSKIADAVFL